MTPLRIAVPDEAYHRNLISCQVACPVHTDARGYVRAIAEGRFEDAYLIARGPSPFASICGRVCGAPCETACRRGAVPRVDDDGAFVGTDRPVAIRALKRFVCERYGPEACGPESVLKRVENFGPPVAANAEEMAALLGCVVKPHAEGFECPCHGSRFTARGEVAKGPAPQPLPWLKVSLTGGVVTVDEGTVVPPGTKVAS